MAARLAAGLGRPLLAAPGHLQQHHGFRLRLYAADQIHSYTRVRLPGEVKDARAVDEDGNPVALNTAWDEETRTLLLDYRSEGKPITVTGSFC